MKFRRNLEHEKAFKVMAIFCLLFSIAFLVVYLVTQNPTFLRFLVLGILSFLPCACLVYGTRRDYVEFQKDKIVFINVLGSDVEINISDIEAVMIPSPKALKQKLKDNEIFFKQSSGYHALSYTPEIEKYILEHFDFRIVYYDNYNKVFKSGK